MWPHCGRVNEQANILKTEPTGHKTDLRRMRTVNDIEFTVHTNGQKPVVAQHGRVTMWGKTRLLKCDQGHGRCTV